MKEMQLAREEVVFGGAILGGEGRFDAGLTGREGNLDLPVDPLPVMAGEKIQRLHAPDLLVAITGNRDEVAIPAQKTPLLVIQIHDTWQTFEHRLRERPLPLDELLRTPPRGFAGEVIQRKRQIRRRLFEQGDLLVTKEARLVGIHCQDAAHLSGASDRKRRRGVQAALLEFGAPGYR